MPAVPISAFTVPANTVGIGLSGYSLTGSNAQSMLDLAGTWNTTGTPTALKLNVTDTASNAASLLMDLQVGGTSRFRVTKAGSVVSRGSLSITDGTYTSSFSLSSITGYIGLFTIGLEGELRWGSSAKLAFSGTGTTTEWNFNTAGIEPSTFGLVIRTSHNGFFGFNTVGATNSYDAIGHAYIDNSNSGLIFRAKSGGTTSEAMRITEVGNIKIGGTANRATTVGTRSLDIFNGTAPAGTLANGISLYSDAGEAYVMDAAGNATLISPHDSETNEWIFRSTHTPTGKRLRIDVERVLRFVDQHFGLDAVHEAVA